MGLFGFNFGGNSPADTELPTIFPFALSADEFIECDIKTTYSMILTDAMERVSGLTKEQEPSLWDSCLQSESSTGLISLLADAMAENADLFLVYKSGVLRKATKDEEDKIRADYKDVAQSSVGVFISFQNYRRTKLLKIYSAMEFCVLAALNKLVNLAKAVQIKIDGLRASVSFADSSIAGGQASRIANALKNGNDVALDSKDIIESASPDIEPTEKAIGFLDSKRAWILSLPLAYISGALTPGIGSTGEADMREIERGLKQYFTTILKPVLKAIFDKDTEFKSQDFREYTSGFEAMKTFELAGNTLISEKSQRKIVCKIFGLDADEEEKQIKKEGDLNEPPPARTVPVPGSGDGGSGAKSGSGVQPPGSGAAKGP